MTKFADQLFDDLMREHGAALAHAAPQAITRRHVTTRRVMLAAAGGVAAAAIAGTFVPGGSSPAYAVTKNPDGTVTLAVYQKSGIAGANAKLRAMGDRVVVVSVEAGCPSLYSLPAPASLPGAALDMRASIPANLPAGAPITVRAHGIPSGDILVVASETNGDARFTGAKLTSGPVPNCVSLPPVPPNPMPSHVAPGGSARGNSAAAR